MKWYFWSAEVSYRQKLPSKEQNFSFARTASESDLWTDPRIWAVPTWAFQLTSLYLSCLEASITLHGCCCCRQFGKLTSMVRYLISTKRRYYHHGQFFSGHIGPVNDVSEFPPRISTKLAIPTYISTWALNFCWGLGIFGGDSHSRWKWLSCWSTLHYQGLPLPNCSRSPEIRAPLPHPSSSSLANPIQS